MRQFGTMAAQPTQHAPIRTRPAAPKPVGVVAVAEAHHKSLVCLKGRRQDPAHFRRRMRELQVGWPFSRSRGLAGPKTDPPYTGATRYQSRQRHRTPKSVSADHAWVIGRQTAKNRKKRMITERRRRRQGITERAGSGEGWRSPPPARLGRRRSGACLGGITGVLSRRAFHRRAARARGRRLT